MKPTVINCCLVEHPLRASGGVRPSYNQNAECKIRSKPTLGLPSIETACLRLAVTCCHMLSRPDRDTDPTSGHRDKLHCWLLSATNGTEYDGLVLARKYEPGETCWTGRPVAFRFSIVERFLYPAT
jgi:hypothetical protein